MFANSPSMICRVMLGVIGITFAATAPANDWEKFYKPLPGGEQYQKTQEEPEVVASSGSFDSDVELMWRRGYGPFGYTNFTTNNNKTKDAVRFGKKLGARYVVVATHWISSQQSSVPLTMPTNNVSTTSGTATVSGSGGTAYGTYSGTTTTSGTSTTYIPITVNRFEKGAIYFGKAPESGTGIFARKLTKEEVALIESQRAFAILYLRDGSPAYNANLLPGDIIAEVNGQPADETNWNAARTQTQTLKLKVYRNSQARDITLIVPSRP
jgi:hypothetical protein